MTADTREQSWNDGQPVMLVDFIRGSTHWRYTNIDRVYSYGGNDYLPLAISRSNIEQGSEPNKRQLKITLPIDADVIANWRPFAPSESIGVTIFETHFGEAGDPLTSWIGQVLGTPNFTPSEATLTCEPSSSAARQAGLQRAWGRGCPHVLYSQGHGLCNADPDAVKILATVTAASALTVTAAEFATYEDGRFAGGYIEWDRVDGLTERRSIKAHGGDTIVISYGSDQLPVGTVVTAYPGCAHNTSDCSSFFNNLPNYGGQPDTPIRSPFDGNPVF